MDRASATPGGPHPGQGSLAASAAVAMVGNGLIPAARPPLFGGRLRADGAAGAGGRATSSEPRQPRQRSMRSHGRLIGDHHGAGPATHRPGPRRVGVGVFIVVDDEIEWYGAHLWAFPGSYRRSSSGSQRLAARRPAGHPENGLFDPRRPALFSADRALRPRAGGPAATRSAAGPATSSPPARRVWTNAAPTNHSGQPT